MRRLLILAVSAVGIVSAGALTPLGSAIGAQSSATPTATTGPAMSISQTAAVLTGKVNPNGSNTTYVFEYGTTTKYGSMTKVGQAGAGTMDVAAQGNATGLAPSTTYNYRLVATNAQGKKAIGLNMTFTTQAAPVPPSRIALFGHTAFSSPSSVFGVFVGCFGQQRQCSGRMTVTASGRLIGRRSLFFVNVNDGGIVHLTLNRTGRILLARASGHHLGATVSVTGVNGTIGQTSRSVTIVPFR